MISKKEVVKIVLCLFAYDNIYKHYTSITINPPPKALFTSVWCHGSTHNDRICRFENLCYRSASKEFVFLKSPKSFISGVPFDRFNPTLALLSSVTDHNRMYFNYVEMPSDNSTSFEISILPDCTLMLKRFNPENLMHVFHDDLLPIFYTLREFSSHFSQPYCKKSYLTFVDDRPMGDYFLFYNLFFHMEPVILSQLNKEKMFCFQHAIVGLNKYTTWYQYGFKQPQGALIKDYSGMNNVIHQFTDFVRDRLRLPKSAVSRNCTVITVRRHNRKILNIDDLVKKLSKTMNTDVIKVSLEDYNPIKIIQLISECEILIGVHGSLLVLSMFLSPGSTLVEIFPYAIKSKNFTPYKILASFSGIFYMPWENADKANSLPHPENLPEFGGISNLSLEEQEKIKSISIVYPPICCYNPEWLYHIYQDTFVNVASFMLTFENAIKISRSNKQNSSTQNISIKPGQVLDLHCYQENIDIFNLAWKPPWNIKFINYKSVEYEIWVQPSNREEISAYITKRSNFTVKWSNSSEPFYIWVKCIVDNSPGPFNDDPMLCFDGSK